MSASQGRLPFDPGRIKGAADADTAKSGSGENAGIITVSQVTRMVKGAIAAAIPGTLHVVGELSNVSQPSAGHLYFTLKDQSSELRCVMWKSSSVAIKFQPSDGLEVVASGTLDVYEPRGQYQFYVRKLEPRGVGALELAFQQLKEKLSKEGLFDVKRKRKLPPFPSRIAVVTSTTGAAISDIVQTIQRRYPAVEVFVFGVRVQGEGAAQEVADAIRRINHAATSLGGIDVIIVGRGGGSLEDLWAFNEEVVARAIFNSAIPIVSAVGHEIDFTIADFVADVRAATPTAAAELVVPVQADVLDALESRGQQLRRALSRMLDQSRGRLTILEKSEWFRDPAGRLRQRGQQIDEVVSRLRLVMSRFLVSRRDAVHKAEVRLSRLRPEAILARRRELLVKFEHRLLWAQRELAEADDRKLQRMAGRLAAVSPSVRTVLERMMLDQWMSRLSNASANKRHTSLRVLESLEKRLRAGSHESVLKRGFTITTRLRGGKVVRAAEEVHEGDRLETQTADGSIASRVIDPDQGELFN